MPASLFPDMDRSHSGLEDQRALQLAFELSMLGLSDSPAATAESEQISFADENRGKKSQNMTECVPVPSSEHVAEIVGRQGCKIKALRAKTNTYIKTPVRGEEPVFVVTGRKEDVAKAKREILSAAEHFSQIRASRKSSSLAGGMATSTAASSSVPGTPAPPAAVPGHVTIQVRVPYRVVGLVVGPKGATIKRIQHQTHTYIVTPSRDKEPVFEVTGLPESVEAARREIEAHIAMRTGAAASSANPELPLDDNELLRSHDDLLANFLKSGFGGLTSLNSLASRMDTPFCQPGDVVGGTPMTHAFSSSSSSSSSSSVSGTARLADLAGSLWGGSRDEGLGESPTSATAASSIWSPLQTRRASFSPPLDAVGLHEPARRVSSDPLAVSTTGASAAVGSSCTSASPTDSMGSLSSGSSRQCIVCGDKEVVAALVPCGHNLFCYECAERVCGGEQQAPQCPACQQPVLQAIRIFS